MLDFFKLLLVINALQISPSFPVIPLLYENVLVFFKLVVIVKLSLEISNHFVQDC